MKYLEDNYISVVVILENNHTIAKERIIKIIEVLKENFKHYELIVVDNMSVDNTMNIIKNMDEKFTIIELPIKHDSQSALTAGVNLAIGDYIVEIEDISNDMDYNFIIDMYKKCQEGNDFVFLAPKNNNFFSKKFYNILNKSLKGIISSDITSSVATLSSRRGQNKTSEVGKKLVNRNVAYILSGLKYTNIKYDLYYSNKRGFNKNFNLMMQTILYYTDIAIKTSQNIAFFFFCTSIFFILYSLYMKFFKDAIEGWASLVIVMSIGFSGIFLILGIILRYLDNILKNTSDSKSYIYRSVDKK